MNAHNEKLDKGSAAEHKPSIPLMAAEHMGSSMRDLVLQEILALPNVWQKLPENKQRDIIDRINQSVQYQVAAAVNTIATQGHTSLAASIESVVNKKEIKVTVIVDKKNEHETMIDLMMAGSGARCQIILGNAEAYIGGMDAMVEVEPDQPDLFPKVIPDDSLLWGINIPLVRGTTSLVPAPDRHSAFMYAQSIREKLLADDNDANRELAYAVYCKPWDENKAAHARGLKNDQWEALMNWFTQLCEGEINVEPVALIDYVPPKPTQAEVNAAVAAIDVDTLYIQAIQFVQEVDKASVSAIQRNFAIGYNRAATLLEKMEADGVVSAQNEKGKREVLLKSGVPAYLQHLMNQHQPEQPEQPEQPTDSPDDPPEASSTE